MPVLANGNGNGNGDDNGNGNGNGNGPVETPAPTPTPTPPPPIANNITLHQLAGQVNEVFNLTNVAVLHPTGTNPTAANVNHIVWSLVDAADDAADSGVTLVGNELIVTRERTVRVRATLPHYRNQDAEGNDAEDDLTRLFTLSFSAGAVSVVLLGLDMLYVGVPAVAEVRFTAIDAVFLEDIFPEDFRITGLPLGLTVGEPRRVSATVVIVPISGTPMVAIPTITSLHIQPTLHARNILRGDQPLPITLERPRAVYRPFEFPIAEVFPSAHLGFNQRATFDLNPYSLQHRDVLMHLQLPYDYELRRVLFRNYELIEGIDFMRQANGFLVRARFLAQLAVGEWPVTFDMHRGANPQFLMNIIDTRLPDPNAEENQNQPGADLDMSLLLRDATDFFVFATGVPPTHISRLGLESGFGRVRPLIPDGRGSLLIRADVLEYLAWRHPTAILEAQTRLGLFRFPTYLLDILRGAKAAIAAEQLWYDEVYVRITFTDVSGSDAVNSRIAQSFPGSQTLSAPTDLTVELLRRSDLYVFFTVQEFLRPFEWVQAIMPQTGIVRYGAFWMNETPSRLEFAPHVTGAGLSEVMIRSIFTGVHAIVNNGAIITDVSWSSWGFEPAYTAARTGLVQVVGGNLTPDAPMSRAEFVQLLSFGLQLGAPGFLPAEFADVPAYHWAQNAVHRALYWGLLPADTYFRPDEAITRAEAIVMISTAIARGRPVRLPQPQSLAIFNDHWEIHLHYRAAVQQALDHGVFIGFPDASLRPNADATRMEVISMMVQLVRIMGNLDE